MGGMEENTQQTGFVSHDEDDLVMETRDGHNDSEDDDYATAHDPDAGDDSGDDEDEVEEEEQDDDDENDNEDEDEDEDEEDEDDGDPFGGFGAAGLSSTLRALTGMMTGLSSRLRDILHNLRQDDLSVQVIALQELAEILLVSNEDNLSGMFSPDAFVKELVPLMSREDSPEVMLLACRCLAHLMEALPASIANVVYRNAVPVLCQKLLEISFIDLAEQALSTLEKISVEYPSSIVREGGLTACLSFLDFFATSTQRTAVTTAANCCQNIPDDSFPVVRDVMPILLNVLNSNDQRVVEQASLCVSGIVESFKHQPERLEELVSTDLLRTVLRLLAPGTTNLIGSSIHTQFLRVLAFTAKASPRLSADLFRLNVVETLYQILTGVSPPSGTEDVASKLDSVIVMQALIHRPREQIVETLNVICELLPGIPPQTNPTMPDILSLPNISGSVFDSSTNEQTNGNRVELLEGCKDEVRRFALILFPTLTDAFSSTVNLGVRQKVLYAQLKMLSNLDIDILEEALNPVPYASFLASILSQQDHSSLVVFGLQATELLLHRLDSIYRYQLYREGVILEIEKLSKADVEDNVDDNDADGGEEDEEDEEGQENTGDDNGEAPDDTEHVQLHESISVIDNTATQDDQELLDADAEEDENEPVEEQSATSSRDSTISVEVSASTHATSNHSIKYRIKEAAQKFLDSHEQDGRDGEMKAKANVIMTELTTLANEIQSFYLGPRSKDLNMDEGRQFFQRLASYFNKDVLESVTSAELLASGMVRSLLDVFANQDEGLAQSARAVFLETFMNESVKSKPKTATADSPATPFSIMIHKLQDLLSRSEHFEVITVHQNAFDGSRHSPASMLGKQIRLRLVADEDSNIPRPYRNIMVSIHAIATFKSLDDYLRPRISLSERPRPSRRDGLSRALAAIAGVGGLSGAAARLAGHSAFNPGSMSGTAAIGAPPPADTLLGRRPNTRSTSQSNVKTPKANEEGSSSEKQSPAESSKRGEALPVTGTNDKPSDTLECSDEKQVSDGENSPPGGDMDAIVGQLDEDMEGTPTPDPSAVNVEVASSGQATARKEDGTRVPTPATGSGTGQPGCGPSTPTPASTAKAMSYASALQAVPQDWHIEFSLDGKAISNDTTIYRAVFMAAENGDDQHLGRKIWSTTHSITFKRVTGPPPAAQVNASQSSETQPESETSIPASLAKNPISASILQLLNILHDMNANVEDVLLATGQQSVSVQVEPLSQFVNTKLTAKLNRQLEEPLIVASSCLPSWSEDLARLYPFLFPFETRHLFLQSTSFGYARSMARWQNAQATEDSRRDRYNDRPFLGRLQRQKVRISRTKILESALKVMDLYGASQSILEVEYFEEVGTGLGPTLEFYSTVSQEFAKKKLRLWRDMDVTASEEFVNSNVGLFPRPLGVDELGTPNGERILHLFKILGKFVARSMIDSRIIDIHLNPIFFRLADQTGTGVKPSLGAVKLVDPGLARSLKMIRKFAHAKKDIDEDPNRTPAQKVADTEAIAVDGIKLEDLCLDFTLPGYANIELEENGSQKRLTMDNVEAWLDGVVQFTLGSGVSQQIDAFRTGFSQVFPYTALSAFTPDELVSLFGRVEEDWSLETLTDSIKADHGYNMDSRSVKNLLQAMSQFDRVQRREFLQFITGSPKLPIGGFRSLTPMFTVVCKPSEHPYTSDDYLPSVMTCVNYLKLPDYSNLEVMTERLSTAMKEGQGAFHLS